MPLSPKETKEGRKIKAGDGMYESPKEVRKNRILCLY